MFADPHQARDATYTPRGEAVGTPVRAVLRDERSEIVTAVAAATGVVTTARVRAAELARPRPRDRLEAGGVTYEVQPHPERDASGVWTLGLVELGPAA